MNPFLTAALAALAASPAVPPGESEADAWRLSWPPLLPSLEAVPDPLPQAAGQAEELSFSAGLRVGYLKGRDAERGTWLVGIQGRLQIIEYLAAEASIEFHQNEYMDGDVVVTDYPVQLSALFFPIPQFVLKPYLLGGVGWYYTRVDYKDSLSSYDSETEHAKGVHVGGGVEYRPPGKWSLNADFRYVFIDEPGVDNSDLEKEEWDYWEITAGFNLRF